MRIEQALVMGARPLLCRGREFPRVPLGAGGWRIEVENRITSKLRINIFSTTPGPIGGEALMPKFVEINDDTSPLIIAGPVVVSIEIYEPGRENYINVRACSQNGSGS